MSIWILLLRSWPSCSLIIIGFALFTVQILQEGNTKPPLYTDWFLPRLYDQYPFQLEHLDSFFPALVPPHQPPRTVKEGAAWFMSPPPLLRVSVWRSRASIWALPCHWTWLAKPLPLWHEKKKHHQRGLVLFLWACARTHTYTHTNSIVASIKPISKQNKKICFSPFVSLPHVPGKGLKIHQATFESYYCFYLVGMENSTIIKK